MTFKKKSIVITGGKGGTGKSTLTALLTQWFLHKNYTVNILDLDAMQTVNTWIKKCELKGYKFISKDADITIIDTAGRTGADFTQEVRNANMIIVPFVPHISDIEVVLNWFYKCSKSYPEVQKNIYFLVNRKQNIKEQKEGIELMSKQLLKTKATLLKDNFSLNHKPAIYAPILNGIDQNIFLQKNKEKYFNELSDTFIFIEKTVFNTPKNIDKNHGNINTPKQ